MLDGTMSAEVLALFKPGDIFTHMYGRVLIDTNTNKVRDYVIEARNRGILFDIGYGAASIGFRQAQPAFKEGFLPNTLGTDLNYHSYNTMKNILNVMSTVLTMGMPFPDIIKASTWAPAQAINHPELGHLTVGSVADVAILSMRNGKFGFVDKDGYKIVGDRRLEAEVTIRNGVVVYDDKGITVSRLARW
jgi:dihydroorotase